MNWRLSCCSISSCVAPMEIIIIMYHHHYYHHHASLLLLASQSSLSHQYYHHTWYNSDEKEKDDCNMSMMMINNIIIIITSSFYIPFNTSNLFLVSFPIACCNELSILEKVSLSSTKHSHGLIAITEALRTSSSSRAISPK